MRGPDRKPRKRKRQIEDEIERFWSRVVVKESGCWEWGHGEHYGRFVKNDGTGELAHRYANILEHGPIPEGIFVCHTCDNKRCVRDEHHFRGTQKENLADMVAKGRSTAGIPNPLKGNPGATNGMNTRPDRRSIGDRNGSRKHPEKLVRKLTDDNVRFIRTLYREKGLSQDNIAALFNVTQAAISCVIRGRTHKHVGDQPCG